jgi:hypothetical protein
MYYTRDLNRPVYISKREEKWILHIGCSSGSQIFKHVGPYSPSYLLARHWVINNGNFLNFMVIYLKFY